MKARVNIHTHDSRVSYDSRVPAKRLIRAYKAADFDAVGLVGHDKLSQYESDDIIVYNGIEHTVSESPEIHVVEYPEFNFRFLAHPRRITKNGTLETAEEIVRSQGLDAMEKYNSGSTQYVQDTEILELANDDAHNLFQVGSSYMEVDVQEKTRGNIMSNLMRGNVELVNNRRRLVGELIKIVDKSIGIFVKRDR